MPANRIRDIGQTRGGARRRNSREIATSEVKHSREELRALSRRLMGAQEETRRSIARELHDDLGQRAALLGMKLDAFRGTVPPESLPALDTIRTELTGIAEGLRQVSHRLHPVILTDLGLAEALHSLCREYQAHGLRIAAELTRERLRISHEVAIALYRIAQESLRNASKYAPSSRVQVVLWAEGSDVCLKVQDHGPGFSLLSARKRNGLGLISMRERAQIVDGTLTIRTQKGRGTTVLACVPLGKPEHPARR